MKCGRCSAEIPAHAQFCMECGASVAATRPANSLLHDSAKPNWKKIAAIAVPILLVILAGFFGLRNLLARTGKVGPAGPLTERAGLGSAGGPLADRPAQANPSEPLTERAGQTEPGAPAEVIDYLKFLKEIEGQRVDLRGRQTGRVKNLIPLIMGHQIAAHINTDEQGEPDTQHMQQPVKLLNAAVSEWPKEWDMLMFRFQKKQPPKSCEQLATAYYDMLAKSSSSMVSLGNILVKAFPDAATSVSDPNAASRTSQVLEELERQLQGGDTWSRQVADACAIADKELSNVCEKYRLGKEFGIKDDGSGLGAQLGGALGIFR